MCVCVYCKYVNMNKAIRKQMKLFDALMHVIESTIKIFDINCYKTSSEKCVNHSHSIFILLVGQSMELKCSATMKSATNRCVCVFNSFFFVHVYVKWNIVPAQIAFELETISLHGIIKFSSKENGYTHGINANSIHIKSNWYQNFSINR